MVTHDTAVGISDEARSSIELTGIIKWFDAAKGYGFIVPDNGMPDILLHVTRLHHDGFPIPNEGARVVVEVQQRDRGLQASRILSMDKTTEVRPAKPPPTLTAISGLEQARVKWFNRLRGFGFLTRGEDSPEIFVHMETIRRFGLTDLRPGQFVLVRFGAGPKGLIAAEVRHESSLVGPA
jgi:CspA family cold shock protein